MFKQMFRGFGRKSSDKAPATMPEPINPDVAAAEAQPSQSVVVETIIPPRQPEPVAQEAKPVEPPVGPKEAPQEAGLLSGLKAAVSLTGKSIVGKIFGILEDEGEVTEDAIDEIEEVLIRADVGLDTATEISDKLRKRKAELNTSEKLMAFLKQEFTDILTPYEQANQLVYKPGAMNVYLVVGVNGAGKTTFIGKLANRYIQQGKKVMIGAGDTFRAAAEEQLEVWAERAGAGFVGAGNTKDPAAVIFDALKQGKESGADVVLLDTAGRLQNKFNLMEELRKVRKVIDQVMPEGAHFESLLVLDATTGQNALKQAEVFQEAVSLDGVVLTKLDGSAKGGVILTIAREYKLPVKMVGVGEGIDDLKDFIARDFVDALFEK
jgi:fused signal recognition particle receptor